MKVRVKKVITVLGGSVLGIGAIAVSYGLWRGFQDLQTLNAIEAQRDVFRQFRQQAQAQPQNPQVHLKLGDAALAWWREAGKGMRLSLQYGRWNALNSIEEKPRALQEAAAAYGTALKLDPSLAEAQLGLCEARFEQHQKGQEAAVTSLCRKAAERLPQSDKAYLLLGIALSRQTQWAAAEAALRQYSALTSDKGNAQYQLGKVLLAQEKTEDAVTAFRQAIQLGAKGNLVYEGLGDALTAQGQLKAAITAYRQSLEAAPEYPPVYLKLGDHLRATQQAGAAVALYRQMIQRYPSLASGYSGLGRSLAAQQNWDEAIAAHQKAIELDPKDAWSYRDRAATLAQHNKLEAAIADYSTALQLDPTYSETWTERGILYARMGKPEAAMADLKRAVQLEPNSVTALNGLCWNGSILGHAVQVMPACEKAIQLAQPADKDFYRDSRGLAYALLGKPKEAIADFQAFLRWTASETTKATHTVKDLQTHGAKRQSWIQTLQKNKNPFTPKVKQELLLE